MKNIGASVSAVLTPEKKEAEAEKVEGEGRSIFGRKTR